MRAKMLILLVLLAGLFSGCRLATGDGRGAAPASAAAVPGEEAPEACGFPPGTALEFAGRSTTAELNVQEVVGDAMSDDPADIYITRDAFDQGELRGRLVCAIFVDTPGFVEVTVHPEDGGRVEPATAAPEPIPPADGIAEDEAVEIARAELPEPDEWELGVTEAGPIGQVMGGTYLEQDWGRELPGDLWVWRVFFVRGDEGIDVVIDYLDGSVLGTASYTAN